MTDFKEAGNTFFKTESFASAIECYTKGEATEPSNEVFPSNLSAAYFEVGDYRKSIEAILRARKLIFEGSKAGLASRLSIRLARALCHGLHDGSVSKQFILENADSIQEYETAGNEDVAWNEWNAIEKKIQYFAHMQKEARIQLSSLPIYKQQLLQTMEFYGIGQDTVMSLMHSWDGDADVRHPMKLDNKSETELSNIAFLFGGVGDARHVYATVAAMGLVLNDLAPKKRNAVRVHFTLLDHHPAIIARDLCIVMLLGDLSDAKEDSAAQDEILSTLLYTLYGACMPSYCYKLLSGVIENVQHRLRQNPPDFPSWVHISKRIAEPVLNVIDKWRSTWPQLTTRRALDDYTLDDPLLASKILSDPSISPSYTQQMQTNLANNRAMIKEYIEMNPDLLRQWGVSPLRSSATARERRQYESQKEKAIDSMVELLLDYKGTAHTESIAFKFTRVFLPPKRFWSRHPGIETMSFSSLKNETEEDHADIDKVMSHIHRTWKPNITLYDDMTGKLRVDGKDPFDIMNGIETFNSQYGLGKPKEEHADTPVFGLFSTHFLAAASALKKRKNQLRFEFILGELNKEMQHMSLGTDDDRPTHFPRLYTRAYLSNVPDYTHGPMNMLTFGLPIESHDDDSGFGANCLLNTGIWASNDTYFYTYALLVPAQIERYFGCSFLDKTPIHGSVVVAKKPYPRPLEELASRSELVDWLTRVLIYTVVPGKGGPQPFRVRQTNNVTTFVNLLLFLRKVGYPAHWLSDFLKTVLSGGLVTDITPYLDEWPIPLSDANRRVPKRRIRLDPWRAEFETILALVSHALPFAVSIPADFALSPSDIALYEAQMDVSITEQGPFGMTSMALLDPAGLDPGVCLLFYKPSPNQLMVSLVNDLPRILNGATSPPPGDIHVLTTIEVAEEQVVRWRFSKQRVEKMRREGWVMGVFKPHSQVLQTMLEKPIPAKKWQEVKVLED